MNFTLDELKIVEFALSNIHRVAPVDPAAYPMYLLTQGKIRTMLKAAIEEAAKAAPKEGTAPPAAPTDNGGGA